LTRGEWEYAIPSQDAEELIDQLCEKPIIDKKRYRIAIADLVWEVDEFYGENAGLVVAEVELPSEDFVFGKPSWVGQDVSHDHRYANANLQKRPYNSW
jgi:adenylate cyclase